MPLQIPLIDNANQSLETVVNNQTVRLTLQFSDIEGYWYFSCTNLGTSQTIVTNIRAVAGALLIRDFTRFNGNFTILAKSQNTQDEIITRNNLFTLFELVYLTAVEIEAHSG